MCCARAIVTAKAKIHGHDQWNSIRQSRRIQEELALELHTKAGVPLHQCGLSNHLQFDRESSGNYDIRCCKRVLLWRYTFVTVCTEVDAFHERSHAGSQL
jgi:hypothetical protein